MAVKNVVDIENLISDKIEELKYINGINGDNKLVKDVVRDTHKDMKILCADMEEIKKNTSFLTKPKIIFAVLIFIVSQAFIFGVWKGNSDAQMENVKELIQDIKQDAHINQEDIKELLKEK